MTDEIAQDANGWTVVLDLAEDRRATEQDALYVQAALGSAGVATLFYPWDPTSDVLTPLGAVRPLKLLVPVPEGSDARALVADVLRDRPERTEVLLPTDDPWVLGYNWRVVALHLRGRVTGRGGPWVWAWRVFWVVVVISVGSALVYAAVAALTAIFGRS